MASTCIMCGAEIAQGILCSKCDRPRRVKLPASESASRASGSSSTMVIPLLDVPMEPVSPLITSMANVLVAAGIAAAVVSSDRRVKFLTDEAKAFFGAAKTIHEIEQSAGIQIGDLTVPSSAKTRIGSRPLQFSLVPLSGGSGGAVLVFRPLDTLTDAHGSFTAFVRETALAPLQALRDAMAGPKAMAPRDAVATIEQILSSLEMAPGVEDTTSRPPLPKIIDVLRGAVDRSRPFAEMKGVEVEVDTADVADTVRDHDALADAIAVLIDNALHYVPSGGQVVVGVRTMTHKSAPILLFFVMDNGPLVPEHLRQVIFEPGFMWNVEAQERTGRELFKVRSFATGHGGSAWVDSKTGKACTFFVRIARN